MIHILQMPPVLAADPDLLWVLALVAWGGISLISKVYKNKKADLAQDPEAQRRARDIQEEIRRRIAERQQQPAAQGQPPPTFDRPEPQSTFRETPRPQAPAHQGPPRNKVEELIRRVEEARRREQEMQRRAQQAREAIEAEAYVPPDVHTQMHLRPAPEQPAPAVAEVRSEVLTALTSAGGIRKAIILSEVLAKPLAERPERQW
jgi:hypothetical protein